MSLFLKVPFRILHLLIRYVLGPFGFILEELRPSLVSLQFEVGIVLFH